MAANIAEFGRIVKMADRYHARLVAVSKTKPAEDILALYQAGQKIFGENYVQELVQKQASLPEDIQWHFIGHLQRNKVKYIAPFVGMIHAVDSPDLLREISKQGKKINRIIDILLQVHIAREETKFGLNERELISLLEEISLHPDDFGHIRLRGLMGMATHTTDDETIHEEFRFLKRLFDRVKEEYITAPAYFTELSMGMSGDYSIALEEGSTLIRIGSLLFGTRQYR